MQFGSTGSKTGSGWPLMRLAVWLIERPRWFKRTLLMINDLVMLSIAAWAAYTLRLSQLYVPEGLDKWLVRPPCGAVAPGSLTRRSSSCRSVWRSTKSISLVLTTSRSDEV